MFPSMDNNPSLDITPNPHYFSSRPSRHHRVLACTSCQQRKVKCDRKFPCSSCVKSRVHCVQATLAPRRRRFSERTLLDRIRKYEDLLRQYKIPFEPLHSRRGEDSSNVDASDDSHDERVEHVVPSMSNSSVHEKPESNYEAKNVFHAMSQAFRNPDYDSDSSYDDLRERAVTRLRDGETENDQHLLFGSFPKSVHLFPLHPETVEIFRLWQVYIDNVNPLLKVLHIPSLQARVIEAASNIINIDANLEALMFSMYCTAVVSLTVEDCQTLFGSSKAFLLSRYQSGCQQALWKCGFLRSNNRDCLTALFLYLISIRPDTTPQALSSMLALAIRTAQRMGIHSEAVLAKCTVFEAEMRRRLWWQLVFFDTRIAELASCSIATLDPTWDCKIPLNVNDTDLRPDMKMLPATRTEPTDSVFAAVRSELGEYLRHAAFHLHVDSSALKSITKRFDDSLVLDSGPLVKLGDMIEDRYLKLCDQGSPIHFMATWTARAQLAKLHLMEHNTRLSSSSTQRVEVQYDAATAFALKMLTCDTNIMTSPLTKGFAWFTQINFPFPAYYQITQDLKRRPTSEHSQQTWDVMSDNWEAWFNVHFSTSSPIFQLFTNLILQAWEAYEAISKPGGQIFTLPRIVSSIRESLAQEPENVHSFEMEDAATSTDAAANGSLMSIQMPTNMLGKSLNFSRGMQGGYAWTPPGMIFASNSSGQPTLDTHMSQVDWTAYGGPHGW